MTILTWTVNRRTTSCPVCGDGESKRGLLHITDYAKHAGIRGEPLDLLQCPSCDARFYDPPIIIDHEPAGLVKFYIEQGAGIDVMLEPLTLLDGRPISRYLEIGCGFGFSLDYARQIIGWRVKGYDPGLAAAHGRQLLGLPISSSYFDGLAEEEGSVDLLFCSEVIEHITDPIEYLRGVRHALDRNGLLLMTTPNGDAVRPDMSPELMPILSPGQHVILYNGRAIRRLLEENGFPYLRVNEAEHQIRVCASRVPFAGEGIYFTRDLLRQYLANGASQQPLGSPLALGLGYRLFKELVNAGRYADGREHYERLRSGILKGYGCDIEKPDSLVFRAPGTMSLSEFGEKWPLNLCGIWYYRGLIQLLHEQDPQQAANTFEAAGAFGRAMRATLHTFGADDFETADLCREAELARLSAFSRYDPNRALALFAAIADNQSGLDPATFAGHLERARWRLFAHMVQSGHYTIAEKVIAAREPSLQEPFTSDGLTTSLAYGLYLLNYKFAPGTAGAVLAAVRQAGIAVLSSHLDDLEMRRLLSEAEIALLAALTQSDPSQALAAYQQLLRNEGGLDPAIFAAHTARARERLFTDLVNLEHYTVAEEVIGSQVLPLFELITSDSLSATFAWGLHLLNHKGEFAAADAVLARVRQACVVALLAHPDDAEMAGLFQEAEKARLAALVQYDPRQVLAAFEELSRNEGGFDAAALSAHLAQARERVFTDLVNLGHYAMAEEVIGPHELPGYERVASPGLATTFACGVYLLNHKSDFAAADAVFGQVWELAHASTTDRDLLWPARFHQGLASRYRGDWEAARQISEEMSASPPDLPPVPDQYRQRLGELVAPSV